MQAKLPELLLFCSPDPQAWLRQIGDGAVNIPRWTTRLPVTQLNGRYHSIFQQGKCNLLIAIAPVTAQTNPILAIC